MSAVFLHCTHTHTGPEVPSEDTDIKHTEYFHFLCQRAADTATLALEDLKPARMGWAVGQAENFGHSRRYRMKDGSVQTNPGIFNPDIVEIIGQMDQRVHVLRFDRENAQTIVFANIGGHPDTIGGCKISADWPGFIRRETEHALENTRCVFLNGAEGDVGHFSTRSSKGEFNDAQSQFDDVYRGYQRCRSFGQNVAGAVMQVFGIVNYQDVSHMEICHRNIEIPSNMPLPEELARAKEINKLHSAGMDNKIPFQGMMLTTVVAEAERMVQLADGPETFSMTLSGLRIGNVALIGLPGEPFTGVGVALKEAPGWDTVLPCCITNGWEGYFPMQDAYDEGGYESRRSVFKAGVAEQIIREGLALLKQLR